MNTTQAYQVLVKREPGDNPITGIFVGGAEEELTIDAQSKDEAFRKSHRLSKLKFNGQLRRTFIDGQEYFDPRF